MVAWDDSANDLWVRRLVAASGVWGTPTQLGTIDGSMELVDIDMDALGNAVAVWRQGDDIWASVLR